jgi:Zn-dependent peptidase ImmA (M78 family)
MAVLYTKKIQAVDDSVDVNEKYIEKLIEDNKIERNPLDVEALIKTLGITVTREDFDYDISGYIEKRANDWFIGLNSHQNERRQRFTMAHELAHFVLHKKYVEKNKIEEQILLRSNDTNKREKEANDYASNLLMPKKSFADFLSTGNKTIEDLADCFNVSIAAARYRAVKLGYLDKY